VHYRVPCRAGSSLKPKESWSGRLGTIKQDNHLGPRMVVVTTEDAIPLIQVVEVLVFILVI